MTNIVYFKNESTYKTPMDDFILNHHATGSLIMVITLQKVFKLYYFYPFLKTGNIKETLPRKIRSWRCVGPMVESAPWREDLKGVKQHLNYCKHSWSQ